MHDPPCRFGDTIKSVGIFRNLQRVKPVGDILEHAADHFFCLGLSFGRNDMCDGFPINMIGGRTAQHSNRCDGKCVIGISRYLCLFVPYADTSA